jgi:hypothetical protein
MNCFIGNVNEESEDFYKQIGQQHYIAGIAEKG